MTIDFVDTFLDGLVSMKSGLEGRNNPGLVDCRRRGRRSVSMKSGLEGRNNMYDCAVIIVHHSRSQ